MRKPKGYWENFDVCKTEALKYETRNHFKINANAAYRFSIKRGWLDEICKHMKNGRIKNT